MTIPLIDKQDTFEVIRDQLVAVIRNEVAAQVARATLEGQADPQQWNLHVFAERSDPWESQNTLPIVNVWYSDSAFEQATSNTVRNQRALGRFNLDCYGFGRSTGVTSGDHNAFLDVHRVVRLVRNIVMHSDNTYLQLRGVVQRRWLSSVTIMHPAADTMNLTQYAHKVAGARMVLEVIFNENILELAPNTISQVEVAIDAVEGSINGN